MPLPPLGPPSNDGRDNTNPPRVPYYSLWRSPDGTAQLANCTLGGFVAKSVGGKAAPLWIGRPPGEPETLEFFVLPVGWVGEWHESPKPQWVVPISGRWFIETKDGTHLEMGPGDIHWGQDIGTDAVNGDQGHRSGQIGDVPCVLLIVQFKAPHGAGDRCPFE
jgi:hypothetical protein